LRFILANSRLVKIATTRGQRRLFFRLGKQRALMERCGAVVDAKQLAAALDVTEKEVIEMERRFAARETSLDSPVRQQDGTVGRSYGELVRSDSAQRPDHQSEAREFRELLRLRLEEFAETLSGRDLEIFRRRLLSEETVTLTELAAGFGVTRERVRQLEERIKQRLRRYLEASLGEAARDQSDIAS
jgi:RNA polymerase sigma-32 factor